MFSNLKTWYYRWRYGYYKHARKYPYVYHNSELKLDDVRDFLDEHYSVNWSTDQMYFADHEHQNYRNTGLFLRFKHEADKIAFRQKFDSIYRNV